MWMNKKQKLKASYYNSFFALIVIPILFIILLSILIIRTMMVDSAVSNIRRAQDNIASTMGGEVKDVSLRLSHFVYVNDNEVIKNAAKTNTKDVAEKYLYEDPDRILSLCHGSGARHPFCRILYERRGPYVHEG